MAPLDCARDVVTCRLHNGMGASLVANIHGHVALLFVLRAGRKSLRILGMKMLLIGFACLGSLLTPVVAATVPFAYATRLGMTQETSALELVRELKGAADLETKLAILEELGALGAAGRPAVTQLMRDYRLAVRSKARVEEACGIRKALAGIGAGPQELTKSGRRIPFCSDSKRMLLAMESAREKASPEELRALFSIPGLARDLACLIEPGNVPLECALDGLFDEETSAVWARALRETFGERPEWTWEDVRVLGPRIRSGVSEAVVMFRGISLFGHNLHKTMGSEQAFMALTQSERAVHREAAAFYLGYNPDYEGANGMLMALLDDTDLGVVKAALWCAGTGGGRSDSVPFVMSDVAGSVVVQPSIRGGGLQFGYRSLSNLYHLIPKPTTAYSRAEFLGGAYVRPISRNMYLLGSEEIPPEPKTVLARIEKLAERDGLRDAVYWSLSHFGEHGASTLPRIETDFEAVIDEAPEVRDPWLMRIVSLGGPSGALIDKLYAKLEKKRPLELSRLLLVALTVGDPARAQGVLASGFGKSKVFSDNAPLADLAALNGPIGEGLGKVLEKMLKRGTLEAAGLLLRAQGGRAVLRRTLADKELRIRLAALVALASLGEEASFAQDKVDAMLRRAKDEKERAFIERIWGAK